MDVAMSDQTEGEQIEAMSDMDAETRALLDHVSVVLETLAAGLTGAKPEKVCHWAFEMVGAEPDDELFDLFPGTGAISKAWLTWQRKYCLPDDAPLFEVAS